jgi:zinc transporter 9
VTILSDCRAVQDTEQAEAFLLKHGENMVDCLGAEVDRMEKNLKQKHPEVVRYYFQIFVH